MQTQKLDPPTSRFPAFAGLYDLWRARSRQTCPTLPEESSRPLIKQALESGINFFDTANSYSDGSSEEIVGRALKDFARRDEIVVATKVYFPMSNLSGGLSRANILQSIDDSLSRLGMDHVDLLQIHRWDYDTPLEETLEALHDVVKSGKARYIGASSMYARQFAKALYTADRHGWTRFVSMQDQYNLIQREEERKCIRCAGSREHRRVAVEPTCAWPVDASVGRNHRTLRLR